MICVSIQNRDIDGIFEILESPATEMAEIRMDLCDLTPEDIDELFSSTDVPLVATCRISDKMSASEAEARLTRAIRAGANYVDLEIEAPAMMSKRVRREAREYGTVLIRSYHDFEGTDSLPALQALVEKCQHLGAEVVKVVTTAESEADVERVMALYDNFDPAGLIAFCMGEAGKESRLECLRRGAPYTYAAVSHKEATAPGQWPASVMLDAVYGDMPEMSGEVLPMPASKSFAQRAIIAAALAEGTSTLRGYSPCGDNESAVAVAKALGASVSKKGDVLTITGTGAKTFTKDQLHTGESGFLTRMMIPILSLISSGPVNVTGEKTLLKRPLTGARDMMSAFGVALEGGSPEAMIPLTVRGRLATGEVEISGKNGSQLISGLLSALPLADGDTEIHLVEPKSIPYIFITLDVLKRFGIRIENEMEGGQEFIDTQDWSLCEGMTFRIRGGQKYKATDIDIEGDWSSAAAFMVAGAVFGKVSLGGLDTHSLQADLSIIDILVEAGASLSVEEETGIIHVQKAPLKAFEVDASNCPDLFPVISVLAAFCQGTSKISGVGRLANKESDRGKAIVDMLTAMGVKAWIKGDRLCIEGHSLAQRRLSGRMLHGGDYTSSKDHRMVMAIKTASLGMDSPFTIDDTTCVSKSFPTFFEIFEKL